MTTGNRQKIPPSWNTAPSVSAGKTIPRNTLVFYFGMTSTRAGKFYQPQLSTKFIASAENTSDCSIWPLDVGVQRVGRAWLVNAKAQLPNRRKAYFSYRGHNVLHSFVFSEQQGQYKQQMWWHHWLRNINRMKMSLKYDWFMLYLPRNNEQNVLICSVLIWPPLVARGTKNHETTSKWFAIFWASSI